MIIFAAYDSQRDFTVNGFFNRITFASLGEASVVCSKTKYTESSTDVTFVFGCNEDYRVTNVTDSGIITLDPKDGDFDRKVQMVQNYCFDPKSNGFSAADAPINKLMNKEALKSSIIVECADDNLCKAVIPYTDFLRPGFYKQSTEKQDATIFYV